MTQHQGIDRAWQQEWADQYAQPLPAREARGQTMLLPFMLGRETFAVAARDVSAATEAGQPVALPGRRGRVVWGLLHVESQLVLAADLKRLLQPAPLKADAEIPRGRFARVLIFGHGLETFAAAVDDVPGCFRLDPASLSPMPVTAPAATVALALGQLRHEGVQMTVLDGARLHAALTDDLRATA